MNISGKGTVSGTLKIYDNDVNGNTVRFGIRDEDGNYTAPTSTAAGDSYTLPTTASGPASQGFVLDNTGGITGTLDMGYGLVEMYAGTIAGTLNAQTDSADALAASELALGSGNGHGASTLFIQYGGEVSGIVNMNGDGSNNHYIVTEADIDGANVAGSITGTGRINLDGDNSTNRFTQDSGSVAANAVINMAGENSILNIYQQSGGTNSGTVNIGLATSTLATSQGVYYQGGGTKNGDAVTMIGGQNLFWLNGNANFATDVTISDGDASKGNNVVVVDLNAPITPDGGTGYAIADGNTIDISGATGKNNMFLANGDILGAITTSGAATGSTTQIFIGYTADANPDNDYSWYRDNEIYYDLTGLTGTQSNPEGVGVSGIPPSYFLTTQIGDTDHLNVRNILSGGGEVHLTVTDGNVYNIKGIDENAAATDINFTFDNTVDPYANVFPYMYPTGTIYNLYTKYSPIYQGETGAGDVPDSYFANGAYTNFKYTADFANNGDYITYSILNMDAVNVGAYVDPLTGDLMHSPTSLTIGAIKDTIDPDIGTGTGMYDNTYGTIDLVNSDEFIADMQNNHMVDYYNGTGVYEDYDDDYGGRYTKHEYNEFAEGARQAQITAGMVNVYAGSKLTVHPNYDIFNDKSLTAAEIAALESRNIIGNLNIVGAPAGLDRCNDCGYTYASENQAIVTIDRTTIHTIPEAAATIAASTRYADKFLVYNGYVVRDDYTANVIVGTNGILQGFGEFNNDNDHSAKYANIIGDVAVLSGGMLRPYDAAIQDEETGLLESGIFVVHGTAAEAAGSNKALFEAIADKLKGVEMKIDGTVYLESASRISTRLYADADGANTLNIVSDGYDTALPFGTDQFTPLGITANVTKYRADAIEVTEKIDFSEIAYSSIYMKDGIFNPYSPGNPLANTPPASIPSIFQTVYNDNYDPTDPAHLAVMKDIWKGVSQHHKVQYVPTFGFVNEIKSKLDFDIYQGTDQTGDQTYYFKVLYGSAETVKELVGMDDANHLFNRDILFSDMLGNWSFLKEADDKGVVLRYRQLAAHPQDGGIAISEKLRNSYEVAKKLDEIRYPFRTAYNMADSSLDGLFDPDPSLDGTGYDLPTDADDHYLAYDGNPYDVSGFNGNIEEHYDKHKDRFGNYRKEWVGDIADYFHALQLNVGSVSEIHRSLRLISAEVYASQANADLNAMNMFIGNRERNALSAMFLVEEREQAKPKPNPGNLYGNFIDPIDEDLPVSYVNNPVRVWASAMGYRNKQEGVGDEYGYTTHAYGVQLGLIKEEGDLYYGLTGGYLRTTNRWRELQSKNKSDNYLGEALLGIRRDFGFFEGHLNYGYMDHEMRRDLTQGAYLNDGGYDPNMDCDPDDNYYNGVYKAYHTGNYKNHVRGGGLRLGFQKVFWDKWLFLPTLGIRYMDIRNRSAFTESGKDIDAFRIVFGKDSIKRQSLQVPLMLRFSRGISFNNGGPTIITPELRLGATFECLDRGGKVENYKWIGNPIPNRYMKAWGIEEDRMAYQIGATVEVSRRGRFYAALNYDLHYRNRSLNHNFSLQSGLNF